MCRQRRRGFYCAIGKDFDGAKRHEHFSHETDAKEFEFVLTRNRERVERDLIPIPLPYTFGHYVAKWLERRKRIRPRATWEPEASRLKRLWLPRLKDRKLSTIHAADIEKVLEQVTRDGRSNATRNRHRAMIHRIFEEARRQHPPLVLYNPVQAIEPLPENWRNIPRVILTEEELERYCREAKALAREYRHGGPRGRLRVAGRHWHMLAELFAGGVLRPSEALAVTVCDFEKLEVGIEKIYCKTEKKIIHRTKGQGVGGSYRSLVMPRLRHILRLAQITLPPGTMISGGMNYSQVLKLHRRTLERAGLPRCGLRVFRHSVARLLKTRDGFTPSEIQELLGHESIAMTPRYTRTGVSHLASRMGRVSKKSTRRKPASRTKPRARRVHRSGG